MSTENFYSELPALESFFEVTNYQDFVRAPQDWYILITDVVDSTKAIEAGQYKEVNLLGACSIGAVVNAACSVKIPFIFGGDGASILIPPSLLPTASQALLATRNLAKQNFGLDLRVGVVPVAEVTSAGYEVKVAKFKALGNYQQAVFSGGGISYATSLIKNPDTAKPYIIHDLAVSPKAANFSGVCCPWQDIRSQHGEIDSLIVKATVEDGEKSAQIYQEVLDQIQKIYGKEDRFHPVFWENLKLSFQEKDLASALKLQHHAKSWLQRKILLYQLKLKNLVALVWEKFNIKWVVLKCVEDRREVMSATDYRKFSDTLNMIITSSSDQRERLVSFLEKKHQQGLLVYGLHTSDRALITCYVQDTHGCHVHFVDGADGGYTLAAKAMKKAAKAMKQAANVINPREMAVLN